MKLHSWLFGCLLALHLPGSLHAIDLKPWFGNAFEFEVRPAYVYQNFNKVNTAVGNLSYPSNDHFASLDVGIAIFGNWNAQIQVIGAQTRAHSFNFDSALVMGQYLWMDDVIGDPVSLTTGITLCQATTISLHDLGSFHHGKFEGELHVAMGQEATCRNTWSSRWWIIGALGLADVGSPWWRLDGAAEMQICNGQFVEAGAYSLWGLGHSPLTSLVGFQGYGPINHGSVDAGLSYTYRFDIWGSLKVGYRRRLYARNFPEKVNYLIIEYFYPFGI